VKLEARFLREARLTAQLDHPAIIPVFEIGRRGDGSLYYAMRQVRGRTLFDAVKGASSLGDRLKLLPHVLTVAQALASAHARGIIHRDVKPQNVMLGSFGETYLLDWGLARKKGRAHADNQRLAPDITGDHIGAVGTPSYMSPEQARGRAEDIDERTDVWGVGAMLYELLAVRPPFVGTSAIDVIQKVRTERPPPLATLVPGAPPELVAICERALTADRDARYQGATELAADLEAYLQGRRVSAHDYSSRELLGRFASKNRAALAVASLALVGLLASGALAFQRITREQDSLRHFTALTLGDMLTAVARLPRKSAVVAPVLAAAFTFYERDEISRHLTDDERAMLGHAYLIDSERQLSAADFDAADATLRKCLAIAPLEPLSTDPLVAGVALQCQWSRARVARTRGDLAAARALVGPVWKQYGSAVDKFPTARWAFTLAEVADEYFNCFRAELEHDDSGHALTRQVLEMEAKGLRRDPNDPGLRRAAVYTMRDASLGLWDFASPEESLAMGTRAIEAARPLASSHDFRMLIALGSVLRQQGMFLTWTERRDEAPALLAEGRVALEQAALLEPAAFDALGELGDLMIEQGDAAAAVPVLERAVTMGGGTDYEDSLALACLLAGRFERSVELAGASPSFQRAWVAGVASALRGDRKAAADFLAQAQHLAEASATQWPHGGVGRLARSSSASLAPAVTAFADEFEDGYASDDATGLTDALTHLAERLK
jgi:serine/threonine protein kinase